MQTESRPWNFKTAINQGRASTLTSPKWRFRHPDLSFFAEISTKKPLKVRYKVSLPKNFQQQIVAQSTNYRMVSTFWQGMTQFPHN